MGTQEFEWAALAWLLTYALHSTVLLGLAWITTGRLWRESERARELVWKVALVGGLVTASVQLTLGVEPLSGRFELSPSAVDARVGESATIELEGEGLGERERLFEGRGADEGQPIEVAARRAGEANEPRGGRSAAERTREGSRAQPRGDDGARAEASGERATRAANDRAHLVHVLSGVPLISALVGPLRIDVDSALELSGAASRPLGSGSRAVGLEAPSTDSANRTTAAWLARTDVGAVASRPEATASPLPRGDRPPLADPSSTAALRREAPSAPTSAERAPAASQALGAIRAFDASPATERTAPTPGSGLTPPDSARSLTWSSTWTRAAILGWGLFGLLSLTLTFVAWRRLRDRLAFRRRVHSGATLDTLNELRARAGLRRPVRLYTSERLHAPIATGVLLPAICLPARSLAELDSDERRAMLAHELAHIARFDPLWLSLGHLLQILFFFQPLNRLARRRMEHSAEMLCDAQAIDWTGERVPLARCLAKVATWVVAERRPLPACGMAGLQSPLATRVQGILAGDDRIRHGGTRAWTSAIALLSVTGSTLPVIARPLMPNAARPTGEAARDAAATFGTEDVIARLAAELKARSADERATRERRPSTMAERVEGERADAPSTDTSAALELERRALRERLAASALELAERRAAREATEWPPIAEAFDAVRPFDEAGAFPGRGGDAGRARERSPRTPAAPLALGSIADSQRSSLDELELELVALRERMDAQGASPEAWQRLDDIEHRVRRVRTLSDRVHVILNHLKSGPNANAPTPEAPDAGDHR